MIVVNLDAINASRVKRAVCKALQCVVKVGVDIGGWVTVAVGWPVEQVHSAGRPFATSVIILLQGHVMHLLRRENLRGACCWTWVWCLGDGSRHNGNGSSWRDDCRWHGRRVRLRRGRRGRHIGRVSGRRRRGSRHVGCLRRRRGSRHIGCLRRRRGSRHIGRIRRQRRRRHVSRVSRGRGGRRVRCLRRWRGSRHISRIRRGRRSRHMRCGNLRRSCGFISRCSSSVPQGRRKRFFNGHKRDRNRWTGACSC